MALLLQLAGTDAIELYNSMRFTETEVRNYDSIVKKFEEHCCQKKNEIFERHKFRARVQREGESCEQFIVDLKLLAKTCGYGELTDSIVRDQIIEGTADNQLREKLLRQIDLTLDKAIQICKAAEIAKLQTRDWGSNNNTQVNQAMNIHVDSIKEGKEQGRKSGGERKEFNREQRGNGTFKRGDACRNCNRYHGQGRCFAFGKRCLNCGKLGHFAVKCRAGEVRERKINVVEELEDPEEEEFYIAAIGEAKKDRKKEWWCRVLLNNNDSVKFKLDTGAQANTLPKVLYDKWRYKPQIFGKNIVLKGYGENVIKSHGRIHVQLNVNNKTSYTTMILVDDDREPILGLKTCEDLELVQRIYNIALEQETPQQKLQVMKEFPKLFEGMGRVKQQYKIRLKEDYVPVIHAARRIPFALKERFQKEIKRMLKLDVIRKVTCPTEWVNPIVVVEKQSGALRICLDPKQLNENIRREHFQIPKREEIEAELAGAQYFSKLDAYSGFYQIPLEKESQLLCTFNTPLGRYCFKRLPFGIASAPEIFHRTVNQIFEGLEGVQIYVDDILVWGTSKQQHDERLRDVLQRAQEAGLTFNRSKCMIGIQELTFLGDRISREGMKPDPEKIEAMSQMPEPVTKTDVHRTLGLINYFSKYIPHLADKTKAIRNLLKKEVHMKWEEHHKKEWMVLKKALTQKPILQYYDPAKETKISTDSSWGGLGAVLLQWHGTEWKPVSYASRALSEAETRYAQIEKEALGMVFGCEKFHDYIYGREFKLETDHKPLLAIVKKNIADLSPRLQRMCIRLLRYHFKAQYTPGKQLVIADALSRAVLARKEGSDIEEDIKVYTNTIIKSLPISDTKLKRIQVATEQDEELQEVITQIHAGWRNTEEATLYRSHRDELTVVEGIIIKGTRLVIPRSMRKEMLMKVHEGHLGAEKCKNRARQLLYWPHMNQHIEDMVKACTICQKYQYKLKQQPLLMRTPPDFPWYRVGTDLFMFAGKEYLVVIDAHSNYPEVEKLPNTSSAAVITALKKIFARHGIPQEVLSDNGPQYASREFKEFARQYEFSHVTSSPYFPRSNGLAEKGVQIVKRLLKKTHEAGEDFEAGLMSYRSTPLIDGRSPAELLMGRNLRTKLPCWEDRSTKVRKQIQNSVGTQPLKRLEMGETVRIRSDNGWTEKGRVMEEVAPRSYKVLTERDLVLRRNREHLNPTKETYLREETGPAERHEFENQRIPMDQQTTASEETAEVTEVQPLRRSDRIRKPVQRMDLQYKKKQ